MYKHKTNIVRLITGFILLVFTMAIMPWAILHSHKHVAKENHEKNCVHQYHIKAQEEPCLLCKVHFEKDFIQEVKTFKVYLVTKEIFISSPVYTSVYTNLIATSLRGPPVFS